MPPLSDAQAALLAVAAAAPAVSVPAVRSLFAHATNPMSTKPAITTDALGIVFSLEKSTAKL
jgi:hypothetical protein